mmetsp:Transcript_57146/g.102125  ORF Transcript_57146/g.102125 Transcript_57146/m.102125 type:complete len:244 (+) Transcript_57146:139-870(+)
MEIFCIKLYLWAVDALVCAPPLCPSKRTIYDDLCHQRNVPQLQEWHGQGVVPVVPVNFCTNDLDPPLGHYQALPSTCNADQVPHEPPDLVPVVCNLHFIFALHSSATLPLRHALPNTELFLVSAIVLDCMGCRPPGEEDGLSQGTIGQPVGPVQSCASRLPYSIQPRDSSTAIHIHWDPSTCVVGSRHDRDGLLCDVHTKRHAHVILLPELHLQVLFRNAGYGRCNVQVDMRHAVFFHHLVDR